MLIEESADGVPAGWSVPATLQFELLPIKMYPDVMSLTGVLSNSGTELVVAYTLAGGEPATSTNPFNAALDLPLAPIAPQPRSEVYPYAVKLSIPPGGRIQYDLEVCLSAYAPASGRAATLSWSFELWAPGALKGKLPVVIP